MNVSLRANRGVELLAVVVFLAACPAAARGADAQTTARRLLDRGEISRGVCSLLGGEAELAVQLASQSQWLVHARHADPAVVSEIHRQSDELGLGLRRLAAEQGELRGVPFADNTVDVVICPAATDEQLKALSADEVLRGLCPGGVALVGRRGAPTERDLTALRRWLGQTDVAFSDAWRDETGAWLEFRKLSPEGLGDWSHWEHGPDNNPVSSDAIIRAPYMTQYMAGPLYIGMPAITTAAGGRTFLAIGHISHHRREWDSLYQLIARNGFNGTELWRRKLPEGYIVHRSAFIATPRTFYMIDGPRCLLLDAATGKQQGEIRLQADGEPIPGHWKWMAMEDDVLYVMTGDQEPGTHEVRGDRAVGGWSWADLSRGYYGPQVPYGFGHTLAAYDLKSEKVLWRHREDSPIDSRSLAISDRRIHLLCPEKHARCLSAEEGKILWTNADEQVRALVAQPGKGLTSTPGFRTACLAVASPEAVVLQGQTRMNVVALSMSDGRLLWTKRKVTNNPNAIFIDGRFVLGVGPRGSHVAIDPISGEVQENLQFTKRACTRLTASADSLFCRGEGTLRFDRDTKQLLIDGAQRPACNDGALPANGLLYLGPWQCDCNLTLIGSIAKCSAGDFKFDIDVDMRQRLDVFRDDLQDVAPLPVNDSDWPTYRGNLHRTSASRAKAAAAARPLWQSPATRPSTPVAPIAVGDLLFLAGDDGKVRAVDLASGKLRWQFQTAGAIKSSPTVWQGRLYVGSADGHAYALEAATGKPLWRFRAAPVDRHIMVYGQASSTWPVHSGVLVHDGVAFFAAGIIDHDGTYVYALDAISGKLRWQNNSSGHLNQTLRKGVSVQGNLSLLGDQLLMAGGNQVSPAIYDIHTGECRAPEFQQGQPKSNNGRYVGVFENVSAIVGGRILHSAAENVSTKGSFVAFGKRGGLRVANGAIPPAWNGDTTAMVNFRHGKLTVFDTKTVARQIDEGLNQGPTAGRKRFFASLASQLADKDAVRWESDMGEPNKFEVVSLAVASDAVVAVFQFQDKFRSQPQWFVGAFSSVDGKPILRQELRGTPLPEGLLIDRRGRVVVCLADGATHCFGP